MNEGTEITKYEFTELQAEIEAKEKLSERVKVFNRAMNNAPPVVKNMNAELKKNGGRPSKATDYDYVPIEVVEEGLRQVFFRQVDFEIVSHFRELNSYVVHSRIRYVDPVTGNMRQIDGIGAKAIQQDKNSNLSDFNGTMKTNGLELAVGIAYSRSLKNAAKKLGKAFGADLNRDEELDSIKMFKAQSLDEKRAELSFLFTKKGHLLGNEALVRCREVINEEESASYQKMIDLLKGL